MKKLVFLSLIGLVSISKVHASQNYKSGNFLLGIGFGAGSTSVLPVGAPQFTIHPSAEVIFGAWNAKKTGIALGLTLDGSINFFGSHFASSIAPMLTLHTTLLPRFDWYVSLGLGLQLVSATLTRGYYNVHVGFATGFNVVISHMALWNFGMAIHADQIFGSTGIKFLFGDVEHLKRRR